MTSFVLLSVLKKRPIAMRTTALFLLPLGNVGERLFSAVPLAARITRLVPPLIDVWFSARTIRQFARFNVRPARLGEKSLSQQTAVRAALT